MTFPKFVAAELARARQKFPAHHSDHEAYAVLLEEVEEAWAEVKRHKGLGRETEEASRMLSELVQIGAMAQRWAEDLGYVEAAR